MKTRKVIRVDGSSPSEDAWAAGLDKIMFNVWGAFFAETRGTASRYTRIKARRRPMRIRWKKA